MARNKSKQNSKKVSLLIIGSKRYKKSSVKLLIEEGRKKFDRVLFVPIHKIKLVVDKGQIRLYYKAKNLLEFTVCYPRLSSQDYYLALPVLKAVEQAGMYMPVTLRSFLVSHHKYYTIRELALRHIPVVPSSLFVSPAAVKEAVHLFGFPVVIKLLSGFGGKGVMLIKDAKQLESILDTVHLFEDTVSAQKFIPDKISDIRCYVMGDKVITVKRTGKPSDWRANVSRGGKAELIPVTREIQDIALASARALGFDICAVDLIETPDSPHGFAVIEVNFMPGPFKAFLQNLIPKEMSEYLYERACKRVNART